MAASHVILSIPHNPEPISVPALRSVLALIFLIIGACQVFGTEQMVQMFDQIGIGQWLRYPTGLLEIFGALLLMVPSLSAMGVFVLIALMLGAALARTVGLIPGSPLAAVILLVLSEISFVQTQMGEFGIRRSRAHS